MALKLAVDIHGRTDNTFLDPRSFVFPAFTGRADRKAEDIESMVASLLEQGQAQAVVFRKDSAGYPILVAGFTRVLAAIEITNRCLKGGNGKEYSPDNPFTVFGINKTLNETDAFYVTVTENATRTELTPMDWAFIIRTAEGFGQSDAVIAKRLGKDAGWVGRHRALLLLDDATRQMVSDGTLAVAPAVNVVALLEPSLRPAVIAEAQARNNGRATSAAITEAAQALGARTGKKQKRSEKEWNSWLKDAIEGTLFSDNKQAFLTGLRDFRNGEIDAYELDRLWRLV